MSLPGFVYGQENNSSNESVYNSTLNESSIELSTEDINVLNNFNIGKRTCWDPSTILV